MLLVPAFVQDLGVRGVTSRYEMADTICSQQAAQRTACRNNAASFWRQCSQRLEPNSRASAKLAQILWAHGCTLRGSPVHQNRSHVGSAAGFLGVQASPGIFQPGFAFSCTPPQCASPSVFACLEFKSSDKVLPAHFCTMGRTQVEISGCRCRIHACTQTLSLSVVHLH